LRIDARQGKQTGRQWLVGAVPDADEAELTREDERSRRA
jgi:hypothetical protein